MERRSGKKYWFCRCVCGTGKGVADDNLKQRKTRQCLSCHRKAITKHGHARGFRSPTYIAYGHMRQRCLNENYAEYRLYGGKRAEICEEWLGEGGFPRFLADMGERPPGTTLDSETGYYGPESCFWVPLDERPVRRIDGDLTKAEINNMYVLGLQGLSLTNIAAIIGVPVTKVMEQL